MAFADRVLWTIALGTPWIDSRAEQPHIAGAGPQRSGRGSALAPGISPPRTAT